MHGRHWDGQIATNQVIVQRFSVISAKSFEDVVLVLERHLGQPDMNDFCGDLATPRTEAAEGVVQSALGLSELMELARFNVGEVLREELRDDAPRSLRLIAGNPMIMRWMSKHVPDAGSYAAVTILIDEKADGIHLSYDTMASCLATYGSQEASIVAQDLDSRVKALLIAAAS